MEIKKSYVQEYLDAGADNEQILVDGLNFYGGKVVELVTGTNTKDAPLLIAVLKTLLEDLVEQNPKGVILAARLNRDFNCKSSLTKGGNEKNE